MERVIPRRAAGSASTHPSPAGSAATEDEGRQILDDTSEVKLSDRGGLAASKPPLHRAPARGVRPLRVIARRPSRCARDPCSVRRRQASG